MKYNVQPKEYRRGYCPTICENEEDAIEQALFLEEKTGFEWVIYEEED